MTPGAGAPRTRSGSVPPPRVCALEAAVGERFAVEIERGAAWFQQDADGWGVTALVDRPRPAAFSCDQDLVLRQSMADRGWAAPHFVARADTPAAAVELPRHSIVEVLGGAVDEPERRRVWHVSSVGLAPVAPRRWSRAPGPSSTSFGPSRGRPACRWLPAARWMSRPRSWAAGSPASCPIRCAVRATGPGGRRACFGPWCRRWRRRGWRAG